MTLSTVNSLAIDAGQSGIRVMHTGPQGTTIRDYAGILTDRLLLPQIVDVVSHFVAHTALPIETVSAGLSGLTEREARADTLLTRVRHLGVTAVYLAHDSVTGYLGSLGDQLGAVVAAGTGIVTLGVGPAGIARVDGWGHIIGDAGSGYWIGRAALEATLRAHDGRGPATSLSILLEENFASPESAYIELQTNPDRVRFIASFAKVVSELAESDSVAQGIIHDAGAEMALSVATALRRAGLLEGSAGAEVPRENPRVSWAGAIFLGLRLRGEFDAALHTLVPDVLLSAPRGLPLEGVALLPTLAAGHPLQAAIHRAT